jgi:glycine betaine/proline transport system substrate-binding protein
MLVTIIFSNIRRDKMESNKFLIPILILLLVVAVGGGKTKASNNKDVITLGEPDWAGIRVKNAVVKSVLENIGYETEVQMASDAALHQAIASGDLDVHLGSWMPSVEPTIKNIKDEIDIVATNMEDGIYTLGVPKYVWDAGVKSFADLHKYADKFDHKLYLGPVGWPFSKAMKKAIEKDIYNLGDWEIVNSNTTALMAKMKRAVKNKEWMVSLAWEPHWMNYILDIKYLTDPKGVWKNPDSWVNTLARQGLQEDRPEVYKFLKQFKVSPEVCNEWIYKVGNKNIDADKVAKDWVKNNISTVEKWLNGVKTANGKPAAEVLKENLGIK